MTMCMFARSTLHQHSLWVYEKHRTQHQTQNKESSTDDLVDLMDASVQALPRLHCDDACLKTV